MANKYWSVENTDAVLVSWSGWKAGEIISVKEGEQYKIYAQQGSTHKTRIWIITDDELNILDMIIIMLVLEQIFVLFHREEQNYL